MTVNVSSAKLIKAVELLLLVAIFGLVLWSQPWEQSSSVGENARTITVSGEATIEAEPDEFSFNPYFEESGTDQDAIKQSLTDQANTTIDRLKELGVEEKDITLDVSSYDYWYWDEDEEGRLTAYITVEIPAGDLVQEVQDYLLTTNAKGQISPRATFSEDKRKELDAQAIEQASTDAKAKAEAQATLFDAKLGDVVSVNQGFDTIFGGYGIAESLDASASISVERAEPSLPVLPGEQEYRQTVTVVYELQ